MNLTRTLANIAGMLLALSGAILFVYGLTVFAITKGQSVESFGGVLLGYGTLLIGVYVSPTLRQGTENAISALRRIADRFFDF